MHHLLRAMTHGVTDDFADYYKAIKAAIALAQTQTRMRIIFSAPESAGDTAQGKESIARAFAQVFVNKSASVEEEVQAEVATNCEMERLLADITICRAMTDHTYLKDPKLPSSELDALTKMWEEETNLNTLKTHNNFVHNRPPSKSKGGYQRLSGYEYGTGLVGGFLSWSVGEAFWVVVVGTPTTLFTVPFVCMLAPTVVVGSAVVGVHGTRNRKPLGNAYHSLFKRAADEGGT